MLKFALEMLWTERKKAYGLIVSIVTTLSICLLFLHFIINPYLAKKVTYDDILDFSEPYCIMLMGLFILMVCVSLICYSCNYYMKLHAREIGMLKMAGFNQGKVVLYQLIQMIMIMVVSVIITCCLSLVTTPIFLTVVYRYCHIHQSIFYFNTRLFSMIGILVVCILIVLIGMQINYINNNSLSSLIKDKYITTQKEDHRVFVIPDYIYILGYFLGLYAMYVGEELDAGFAIASCIGAISAYGLFYYFIPHTLNEMVDSLNLKGEDTIVLGDLALFMQQSKLLIVFIMLAVILIPTFIFSSLHMKMLHIALHIGAVLINFVLCLSVVSRFDIDALGLVEDSTDGHYPKQEGFSSCHLGAMHACGHDGHASIGLTTAKILMELKEHLHGTLKIIFQPAEEGVRGAKSICESGFLDDVDYIFAAHIMPRVKDYDLYFGMNESFATTKLDVIYHGVSTHAAESPQFGKNALLSAANCIINLHSIPRNSDGQTRVNVGTVHAGTGRNVVPDTAKLEIEVRGVTTELNRYMEIYARDIINACALMHDTVVEIKQMGKAFALNCDEDFMNQIRNICVKEMPDLKLPPENLNPLGGSDDFSYMMEYVQVHGGKATYMKLLTDITASPHNTSFNFNEEVLNKGPRIMASIAYTLLK